jgi:hypothetical protein
MRQEIEVSTKSKRSTMRASTFAAIIALFLAFGCSVRQIHAQVAVTLAPAPIATFLSASGAPLAGGRVYTYQAGTNTPQPTFSDSTGTVQNANPTILDAAGRANIWFSALAYKIVVQNSGGVTQYTTDNFQVSPFLAGNNSYTGNNTFAGTATFNGSVTFSAGGALSGAFSGSPTFSGNPTFSGTPTFSNTSTFNGVPAFTAGIKTDAINGNTLAGIVVTPQNGTTTLGGGNLTLRGGNGGPGGGIGGDVDMLPGNALSGNSNGGNSVIDLGSGSGTGNGGLFNVVGAVGGSTAGTGSQIILSAGGGGAGGNGGDVSLTPGIKGGGGQNGSVIIGQSGRIKFSVNATAVSPACSSTGLGGGTCTMANFSTDSSGIMVLTAGAAAAALGRVTLTFNGSAAAVGPNGAVCMYQLSKASGIWDPRATVISDTAMSSSGIADWDNNSVSLVNASTYNIHYWCRGEN